MLFNVPQNINVEDKIAGPLTGKQLLWMFGMGATLLLLYVTIPKGAFYAAAFPVVIIFAALAFYKPQGQPLISFIFAFFFFAFKPKIYVWKKNAEQKKKKPVNQFQNIPQRAEKNATKEDFAGYAQILDTRGEERNSRVMDYLHAREEAKLAKKKK